MGYKKIENHFGFADLALAKAMKHNRSLKMMERINRSIGWDKINAILMSNYTVGSSGKGVNTRSALLLFKCFLLQK